MRPPTLLCPHPTPSWGSVEQVTCSTPIIFIWLANGVGVCTAPPRMGVLGPRPSRPDHTLPLQHLHPFPRINLTPGLGRRHCALARNRGPQGLSTHAPEKGCWGDGKEEVEKLQTPR